MSICTERRIAEFAADEQQLGFRLLPWTICKFVGRLAIWKGIGRILGVLGCTTLLLCAPFARGEFLVAALPPLNSIIVGYDGDVVGSSGKKLLIVCGMAL